jgi:predicted metal-dependent phosphoesterase TrpH
MTGYGGFPPEMGEDPAPFSQPDPRFPFWIDLHVHTARYSGCAESLDPRDLAEEMSRKDLSGLVLAEHDQMWQVRDVRREIPTAISRRIFRGVECSAVGCHLVIIGVPVLGPLRRGISQAEAAGYAHAHGGAVILAHPYRGENPDLLPFYGFDAIEVASSSFTWPESKMAVRLARRLGLPMVAGSDAHSLSRVGCAVTCFQQMPQNERELAAMIRAGRGVPRLLRPLPGWVAATVG